MTRLFYSVAILGLLMGCKKNEAPPEVCYTCTTVTTTITKLPGTPGVKESKQAQDVCGDRSKETIMIAGNKSFIDPGISTYIITKCVPK